MNYGNGMCIDTGIKFYMNSGAENLLGQFPVISLVLVLGCLCTQEISFS